MSSTISKTASTASTGSGSTKSTSRMSPCKYCRGEVEFCDRCKRRFRESVSNEKCERIAFGSEREDFERMKKDLEELVDKKETVILSHEQFPGSTQTPHQRRRTLRLAKKGMDEHEIKLAVEEQKRNKEDLPGLELEVMPTAAYQQLANIHDGTRSWLHKHEKRIEGHNKWLKQNAVDREISRQDMKIDASGEDSLKTLADSNPMPLKKMKDKKRDIGFVVVRKRVEARAREYLRAER